MIAAYRILLSGRKLNGFGHTFQEKDAHLVVSLVKCGITRQESERVETGAY